MSLWRECPSTPPSFERTYTRAEQEARERELDRFFGCIQAEFQRIPSSRAEREAARERITAGFVHFARAAPDLEDSHIELMLGSGFSSIGTEMARQARRFDPAVSTNDIFQASRNAWTACGLQKLLGREMRLTPGIFAYSMLYPYTDNYLDNPRASCEAKAGFNGRFAKRLAGDRVPPANGYEEAIWRLVELIEGQYARDRSPQVFASLLAIQRAQAESVRLLRAGGAEGFDVLPVVFAKGGTSVLADGYLAAESLSPEEARFVYCWGVLLQLADDLQDVRGDCADGVMTLFTRAAPLDSLTDRTLHFAARVMERMEALPDRGCRALKDLIARSAISLIVRAAGEARALYTPEYIAELETHSSLRFAFLEDRRRRLARHGGLMPRLFEAFLQGEDDEPAFPLLPDSLLPRM